MESLEAKVKEIISKTIKVPVDQLGNDDDLVERHGMDSLARVEIVTDLEREFDVRIEDSVSIQLRSVSKCLEVIRGQSLKK
jgi:acyl carrier protein